MSKIGVLAALRDLLVREAPAQKAAAEEALRLAAARNVEHSVIGGVDDYGVRTPIVSGGRYEVTPSARAIRRARDRGSPIFDMHTHPLGGTEFDVAPSTTDFNYYAQTYPGAQLRTLIATPPNREQRALTGYHFFETDDPAKTFNSKMMRNAAFEAKHRASKGAFSRIKDDPVFADYFDFGGGVSDLIDGLAPVTYLGLQASKGLGRQKVRFGGRSFTPDPSATQQRAYDLLNPELEEFLRSRKFSHGGHV